MQVSEMNDNQEIQIILHNFLISCLPNGKALHLSIDTTKAEEELNALKQKWETSSFQDGQVALMKFLVANYPQETWLQPILSTVRRPHATQSDKDEPKDE